MVFEGYQSTERSRPDLLEYANRVSKGDCVESDIAVWESMIVEMAKGKFDMSIYNPEEKLTILTILRQTTRFPSDRISNESILHAMLNIGESVVCSEKDAASLEIVCDIATNAYKYVNAHTYILSRESPEGRLVQFLVTHVDTLLSLGLSDIGNRISSELLWFDWLWMYSDDSCKTKLKKGFERVFYEKGSDTYLFFLDKIRKHSGWFVQEEDVPVNEGERFAAAERIAEKIRVSVVQDTTLMEQLEIVYSRTGIDPYYDSVFLKENSGMVDAIVEGLKIKKTNPKYKGVYEAGANSFAIAAKNQLRQFSELEQKVPNGISVLNNPPHNISGFFRYNTEMLERQLTQEYAQMPHGILIQSKSDHNGSFNIHAASDSARALWELEQSLADNACGLYIIEVESERDLRRLLKIHARNIAAKGVDGVSASFVIVNGHGTSESIHLSDDVLGEPKRLTEKLTLLTERGLTREKPHWLQKLFTTSPQFIFNSCSTGAYGGIAETLSPVTGSTIIAPTQPAGVQKYRFNFDEEKSKIKIDVTYKLGKDGQDPKRVINSAP